MQTAPTDLSTIALTMSGIAAALVLLMFGARVWQRRNERLDLQAEEEIRELALALVHRTEARQSVSRRQLRALARLLVRYGRTLRGESRQNIARFFAENGDVEKEIRALRSVRTSRRAEAAFLLGTYGAEQAVTPLAESLCDKDEDVRVLAAQALARLAAVAAVKPLAEALADGQLPRPVAADALLAIGEEAEAELRGLLGDESERIRALACEMLGHLGAIAAQDELAEHLRDPSAHVRAAAAAALAQVGDEDNVVALRETLHDRIGFVRAAAATALARIGDRDAVNELLQIATSDADETAAAAASVSAVQLDPAAAAAASPREGGEHLREALARLELHGRAHA